ncbi:MAG: uracil phosphoribosyltransferase [Oligoflexia bacterium]|nr:uracil phosphoribosyltransferase [Oligoflexia bacterium]
MNKKRLHILTDTDSLVSEYLAELRNIRIQGNRERFRQNLRRIGICLAYEISKQLKYTKQNVRTPLGSKVCSVIGQQPVVGSVLRAGVALHEGLLEMFPDADNAFVGAYRQEGSAKVAVKLDYVGAPKLRGRVLIFGDPMLASGTSMIQALRAVMRFGQPKALYLAAVIASRQGVARVLKEFPEANLWVGAMDPKLDAKAYIVPGLGDAGDLAFGPKV